MMRIWIIRGVPRTTHTTVLTSQRRGVIRLMAPRAMTRPRGSANKRVRANSFRVVPSPSSKVRVTVSSIGGSSLTAQARLPGGAGLAFWFSAVYFSMTDSWTP